MHSSTQRVIPLTQGTISVSHPTYCWLGTLTLVASVLTRSRYMSCRVLRTDIINWNNNLCHWCCSYHSRWQCSVSPVSLLPNSVGVYSSPGWIGTRIMLSTEMLWRGTKANVRTIMGCLCLWWLSPSCSYSLDATYKLAPLFLQCWIQGQILHNRDVNICIRCNINKWTSIDTSVTDDSNLFLACLWPYTHHTHPPTHPHCPHITQYPYLRNTQCLHFIMSVYLNKIVANLGINSSKLQLLHI